MPIRRREEEPDALSPVVWYLWRKKWALLLPALGVLIATYLITYLIEEEFVAQAQVYVNRHPTTNAETTLMPNPNSVASLLKSEKLLWLVREDFANKFNAPRNKLPIERFAKMFRVKTAVLQDTSVRKDIDPVIDLSLQATGKEQTRFLMESWLRHFMQLFGNYATQEMVQKRDALMAENERLEEELSGAEQELADLQTTLPLSQKMLLELADTVAPADLPQRAAPEPVVTGNLTGAVTGGSMVNVSLNEKPQGLLWRLTQLNVEEAMARATQTSRSLEAVMAERAAVVAAIADAQSSITQLQGDTAQAAARADTLQRRIRMLTAYQVELRGRLSEFAVGAAVNREAPVEGPFHSAGDVRIVSDPVTPELKVWPRRTLLSLAAATAVFVAIAVALIALRALRRAAPAG